MQNLLTLFVLVAGCICSNVAALQPTAVQADADDVLGMRVIELKPETSSLHYQMENKSSKTIVAWDYQVRSFFPDGRKITQGHVVDTYSYYVPAIRQSMDDPGMTHFPQPPRPLTPGEKRTASFRYSAPDGKKISRIEIRAIGVVFDDLTEAGSESSIAAIFAKRRDDKEEFKTIHEALKEGKRTGEGMGVLRRKSREIREEAESARDPEVKWQLQIFGDELERMISRSEGGSVSRPAPIPADRMLDFWIEFYASRSEAADRASRRPEK